MDPLHGSEKYHKIVHSNIIRAYLPCSGLSVLMHTYGLDDEFRKDMDWSYAIVNNKISVSLIAAFLYHVQGVTELNIYWFEC